jgi:hypothetical protein
MDTTRCSNRQQLGLGTERSQPNVQRPPASLIADETRT